MYFMYLSNSFKIIITVDGLEQPDKMVTLSDDGAEHSVRVASVAMILN